MPGRMRKLLVCFVVTLVMSGCSDDDDTNSLRTSTTTTTQPPVAPAEMELKAGGLDNLVFDSPSAEVIAAVKTRFGAPEKDGQVTCDSGSDRTVAWPAISLVFAEDKWVGYSFESTTDRAATDKGIRVGSTVAELKAAYPSVKLDETSLGIEWFVEFDAERFLSGSVSGLTNGDKVDRISSGDICAFR